MLSQATTDIIDLLSEEGEEPNTLQRVMLEFLKRELPNMLEVEVYHGDSGDYYSSDQKVKVKLKLCGELFSEDYFTYTPGERKSGW